jgi:hypothetical protein
MSRRQVLKDHFADSPEDGLEARLTNGRSSFWVWASGSHGITALAILMLGLVALLAVWVSHH